MANIRNRNCRVARTIFTITTCQLFSKVHRIAMGAAVTAGKYLTTRFKTVSQQDRRALNGVNIGVIF
ncbi:Uncharacterised protein [Salmonella enterica subsp. enterica serovar Typhi]|nr:Uncharacterised protein [Salmonella enterica subsp. enterica serovar Typhi]